MQEIFKAWFEENQNCDLVLMAEVYDPRCGFYKRCIGNADRKSAVGGEKWEVSFVAMRDEKTGFVAMHDEKKDNSTLRIGAYDTKRQAREALQLALFGVTMLNTKQPQ